MSTRRTLFGALAGCLFLVLGVLGAAPAWAHAELKSTEPPAGTAVAQPPDRIVLHFTESVEVAAGAVRVIDQSGKRVDGGRNPTHVPGDRSAVTLPLPKLADGTYVVTWRVVSADSHPVHGAFTFKVGTGPVDAASSVAPAGDNGSAAVGFLYGLVRFLVFASLLLLVGGTVFLVALWPAGWQDRRARRLVWGAWAAAVVATAASVGLQGAYGAGLPLADAFKPSLVRAVLDTRYGHVALARLLLLAVSAGLLKMLSGRRQAAVVDVALSGAIALALLATPGLSAHAATGDLTWLALPVDVLHLAAGAFWLGGLALLTTCVLRVRDGEAERGTVVSRFSRFAFGAVVVLVLTGSFQSWRQVRELDGLTSTTYGRLLLVKVGVFVVLVAVAAVSRSWLRRRYDERLRRSVAAETVLALAVLAVTSLLVNAVPARSALARPVTEELEAGKVVIDLTVDPAKRGPVAIHLYALSPTGQVQEVEDATVQLRLPSGGVGPLNVPMTRAGPGHFAAYGFEIPLPGTWRIDVSVRLSEFDVARAATSVRIR
jgi:copper transport protein